MTKQIIIAEQHRIAAVFSEDQIQELVVATGEHQVSDIHLGIVENVLPSIDAAFVNLGDTERNGFIHVTDLGPVRLKKTAGSITELLAPQQKVLVQVMKEPTGNKGPRLTGNISLPGRYLVLMPYGKGVNLSRRIREEEERSRLRALGILIKPAGMGLLVRTEAEDVAEEAIIEDLEHLQGQWESIQQQALSTRAPALLNRDDDFIQRVLRDVYSADVNRIVVDSPGGLKRVKQHLTSWNGNRLPQGVLIDQHREGSSILEYFRVNAAIKEALKPRVDLPSGGYIIIERTEALTVVDVNSGSFTRSATARETVLWTNCEAATEIARQLRLRNIAGVIIVDFIDMDARRDQLQVLESFNKALRADKARPQIAQLTELGLIELTRKRQGQNIYELFSKPCATCGGLGHMAHLPGETPDAVVEQVPVIRGYEPGSAPSLRSSVELNPSRDPSRDSNRDPNRASLDASSNLQELDLTNHPNYQERGSRRRRRGRRLGETLPRENATPSKRLSRQPSGKLSAETVLPAAPLPEESGNGLKNDSATAGKKLEKTAPERTKPSRTEVNKGREEAPPDIISVTMTPTEQDVFAFMGISPLVLFNGEVSNPRTAILQIQLPGESSGANGVNGTSGTEPTTQNGSDSPEVKVLEVRSKTLKQRGVHAGAEPTVAGQSRIKSPETENPSADVLGEDVAATKGLTAARDSAGQNAVRSALEIPSPAEVESLKAADPISEASISKVAHSEGANSEAANSEETISEAPRRRRRRSSAAGDDAKQLSLETQN
ncbi:MAG: Rne/Rng family ribonuclease [Thermosynechococcaceae cyanobacterium MS004]|nr:Rne/Rng family ribonuclease [Thermosynechococcaceae cyanobacterium MS004]